MEFLKAVGLCSVGLWGQHSDFNGGSHITTDEKISLQWILGLPSEFRIRRNVDPRGFNPMGENGDGL